MKNVNEYSLKKCIFMAFDEYIDLIEELTDGLKSVECDFDGMFYINTEKVEEKDTYFNADIKEVLSKYFDVTVTSVHIDDYDDIGVWIVYR